MTLRLTILAVAIFGTFGCKGGEDGLDKAAAPTTSSKANAPANVDMKKTKAPPLAGPGAKGAGGGNF